MNPHSTSVDIARSYVAGNTDVSKNSSWVSNAPQARGEGEALLVELPNSLWQNDYEKALQDLELEQEKRISRMRRKWRNQTAAGGLLSGTSQKRVSEVCRRKIAFGNSGVQARVEASKPNAKGVSHKKGKWHGLAMCSNVWACPTCSAQISTDRAEELNKALAWARVPVMRRGKKGPRATPMLLTLTARHGREDNLGELLEAMIEAKRQFFQSDDWRDLRVEMIKKPVFLKKVYRKLEDGQEIPLFDQDGNHVLNETLEDTGVPCLVKRTRTTKKEPITDPITGRQHKTKRGALKFKRIKVDPYVVEVQKQKVVGWVKGSGKVVGQVVAVETTWGEENGWHPHFHILVFLDVGTEKQADRYLSTMRKHWMRALKNNGLSASGEHGFRIDGGAQAGEYIAKFGTDALEAGSGLDLTAEAKIKSAQKKGEWGVVQELTASQAKKARGKDGATPWQLLDRYANPTLSELTVGQKRAGALFAEFATTFRRKLQLQWSPGLKDLVGVKDKTDEELVKAAEDKIAEDMQILGLVDPADWSEIVKKYSYTDRETWISDMINATPDEFWAEFASWLGREPSRSLDNARLLGIEYFSDEDNSQIFARSGPEE